MTKSKKEPYIRLFEAVGVVFSNESGKEHIADECPYCGKENKFYVNGETGQFDCKVCGEKGNAYKIVRRYYDQWLRATTDDQYRNLKRLRELPIQALKRNGLAYDDDQKVWLIPIKNLKGAVINLIRYCPSTGKKYNLPALKAGLFGLDELNDNPDRTVMLCEGPLDAIALDSHLTKAKTRNRYAIVAVLGAETFSDSWIEHFRGRKVRVLLDNDESGRKGSTKIAQKLTTNQVASDVMILHWPKEFRDKFDISDLLKEHLDVSVPQFVKEHSTKHVTESRLNLRRASECNRTEVPVEWLWDRRVPLGSSVTLFGPGGTYKSTIARELAARVTAGLNMPDGRKGIDAGAVIYITSEDSESRVIEDVERFGGNLDNLLVQDMTTRDGEQLNLLNELESLRHDVKKEGVRLVIVDALNSFMGTADIQTDMKGRANVSNKLHDFAQKTGVCLVGLRNAAEESNRPLGSQSMSDISRCIMQTEKTDKGGCLTFKKVNDSPPSAHSPIPFSVKDCGGHHRQILWGKSKSKKSKSKGSEMFPRSRYAKYEVTEPSYPSWVRAIAKECGGVDELRRIFNREKHRPIRFDTWSEKGSKKG